MAPAFSAKAFELPTLSIHDRFFSIALFRAGAIDFQAKY